MSSALLDNVIQLMNLGVGDTGRLEHIKDSLVKNKNLYLSDSNYVNHLIDKYISRKESQVVEIKTNLIDSINEQKNLTREKSADIVYPTKSLGYKKSRIIIVTVVLLSVTIFFNFYPPSQYFSKELQNMVIYLTSSVGLILEILGFLVFMMIEKKADFGGGSFDGGDVTVNGKPLQEDEHIVIRNVKHEKKAIDLVVIGLILQLSGIWYALQKLTLDSNLFSVVNP